MIATGQVRVGATRADGDATCWMESRPAEGGRTTMMCHRPDRGVHAITPAEFNCRTRVHEYGGGAYAIHDMTWTVWDHPNMPWDATELMVGELSPEGGLSDVRRVAGGGDESIFQPAWSPAGSLHFVSDRSGWWNLCELAPHGVRALAPMQAEAGEAQWMFAQSSYAFVPEGIAVVLREGPRQRLALISSQWGEVVDLPVPHTSFDVPYLRAAGNRLVFVGGTWTETEGVVSFDRDSGRVETLRTTLNASLAPSCISVPHEIAFPTGDGATAHALFYAPRNGEMRGVGDELPPAIVVSHAGPTGQASTCLDLGVQAWTSRGFAVIDVDYRGSTGYGRAYREALRGQWGVADVEDCVNAARHLAAEVDPRRLAIRGASAGGYTTLCALTFTDVFAAGASYFGVGDLESLLRETHNFEARYLDALIGPYPEQAELYRERSPIHAVDRLRCPVILLQGELDEVVPPDQASHDGGRAAGRRHPLRAPHVPPTNRTDFAARRTSSAR